MSPETSGVKYLAMNFCTSYPRVTKLHAKAFDLLGLKEG
jgi:hypothetical protein